MGTLLPGSIRRCLSSLPLLLPGSSSFSELLSGRARGDIEHGAEREKFFEQAPSSSSSSSSDPAPFPVLRRNIIPLIFFLSLFLLLSTHFNPSLFHFSRCPLPTSSESQTGTPFSFNTTLDHSRLAVLIERRDIPLLIPILHIFLTRTPLHWPFLVYHGQSNYLTLTTSPLLAPFLTSGRLTLKRFPEEFIELNGGTSLSRFLTRPWFWEQLEPAEWLFFFQVDSIICAKSERAVDDFLGLNAVEGGYDWVGAPWNHRGYPTRPWGGNGGFSLRKRSTMLSITRQFGEEWDSTRPAEDYWFAHKIEETSNQFPPTDLALRFSFETPPVALIDTPWVYQPFGVHIGGGRTWGLCPGRSFAWGTEQVAKLLEWCPEARMIIPDDCLPR